jgi:hypothetical protein
MTAVTHKDESGRKKTTVPESTLVVQEGIVERVTGEGRLVIESAGKTDPNL